MYAVLLVTLHFTRCLFQIVDSPKQPNDLLGFLLSISEYVLSEGVELKDGETIGFSEEQKLPITLSDGVSVPGKTLKIKY